MTTHILILCTHNSARSILGEAMLNHWAGVFGRDLRAHSAGSAPSGRVNPMALEVLASAGIDTRDAKSKSRDAFTDDDAPAMRIVITVCDSAAAEQCPYWPGSPVTVHWGLPDPSGAPEARRREAFEATRQALASRMRALAELPIESLSDAALQSALQAIHADRPLAPAP
jgi:arsenate reductase